jgi:hypothetical protein
LRVEALSGKALREMVEVMNGVRSPVPELLRGGSPGATEPSDATVVVEGSDEGWRRTGLEPLLERVLLVRPEAQRLTEGFDHQRLQSLLQEWRRHLHWRLDRRRRGCGTIVDLGGNFQDMEDFARRNQDYVARCRQERILNSSVLGLPRAITAVLLACYADAAPRHVVQHAFLHAERLLEGHLAVLLRLRGGSEVLRIIGLATKLHRRLRKLEEDLRGKGGGEIKFRDLIRGFDEQRKEVHQRVIEMMKKAGLVIEPRGGIYRSGPETDVDASIRKTMAGERFRVVA